MNNLVLASRYMRSVSSLAPRDRKAVDSAVMEFARGSTKKGLRLHKLNCREARFHSISASDSLRIIVLIDGETRIMMHAGHHDEAYRWAASHEVRPHERSQVPQIIEFVEAIEDRVNFESHSAERSPIFKNVLDEQLVALGLPTTHVPLIRQIHDEESLTEIGEAIPEEAWEALIEIAAGNDVSELIAERTAERAIDHSKTHTMADALASPQAQRQFWVADSEDALAQALQLPWAAWRIFLHSSQSRAVASNYSGPARITGGAGTGKSVVLIHRAARLARENKESTVLLSTFSKVLAAQLESSLDELLGGTCSYRHRVKVQHLHAHAIGVIRRNGDTVKPASTAVIRRLIDEAISESGFAARSAAFVRDEWHHVVDCWGVTSIDSYLGVSRKGRGMPLNKSQRKAIWPVFEKIKGMLKQSDLATWADICERASTLTSRSRATQYDYVLLDESQDFGPRDMAYAALLSKGGENGLYLGSDDGQRIYQNPFSLAAIGINIRGRSRRLRVNYRTTAEIHEFAASILPNETLEDDSLVSRRVVSLFSGVVPAVINCSTGTNEASRVLEWIRQRMNDGVAVDEIALFSRSLRRLEAVEQLIDDELGLSCVRLAERREGALIKDTLHGGKGMEFRAVVIVGVEDQMVPLQNAMQGVHGDEAYNQSLERERHLLYVGCTRARDALLLTYVGAPSRFLSDSRE